jgi:predicted negative regulator of RcsB-dependent stress response
VEQYRTEEEQVQALRRWWNENGKSTVAIIVIALAAGLGWQAWQRESSDDRAQASDLYQALLRAIDTPASSSGPQAVELAEQLKTEFSDSSYAQFAALQLAAMAVKDGNLAEAEAQLRWVLGKAPSGSDTAQVAQLRLARVVAAAGNTDQALDMLSKAAPGAYAASYALAQGDILLAASRKDEARDAYTRAMAAAGSDSTGVNLVVLQQKLQSLTPIPPQSRTQMESAEPIKAATVPTTPDTTDASEE